MVHTVDITAYQYINVFSKNNKQIGKSILHIFKITLLLVFFMKIDFFVFNCKMFLITSFTHKNSSCWFLQFSFKSQTKTTMCSTLWHSHIPLHNVDLITCISFLSLDQSFPKGLIHREKNIQRIFINLFCPDYCYYFALWPWRCITDREVKPTQHSMKLLNGCCMKVEVLISRTFLWCSLLLKCYLTLKDFQFNCKQ